MTGQVTCLASEPVAEGLAECAVLEVNSVNLLIMGKEVNAGSQCKVVLMIDNPPPVRMFDPGGIYVFSFTRVGTVG